MAVTYTQTLSTDMVVSEIEALFDWHSHIMRRVFFPTAEAKPVDTQPPSTLLVWARREVERGTLDRKIEERMSLVYDELCKTARQLHDHVAGGAALTVDMYDTFEIQVEGFVTQLRRLQQDLADTAGAVDMVTGLRTVAGMKSDLKREQDRFDRKGTSFSLANVEIDSLTELQSRYDRRMQDAIYAGVAHVIAGTVRSFDDAYYLGKGEYLIVLKHVEFMDACAVMDRLRLEIQNTPIFLPGGDKANVTASFGIAEALQRENVEVALTQSKTGLNEAKGSGGNRVVEYREKSVLEQYAKDMHRK